MRALLGLEAEPKRRDKSDDGHVGELQITFSSGLSAAKDIKRSVFENEPQVEETTVEKYARKERERKQKRKEKMKHSRNGAGSIADGKIIDRKTSDEPPEDLGFDDPFFAAPEHDKASITKMRKEERLKKRAEREAEEAAAAAKRAELELLMVDDKDHDGKGIRHFDMKTIERQEKNAKKKGRKGKDNNQLDTEQTSHEPSFEMDTHDPRFARLYENHEFAIDPTNPRFKGTEGMRALLEEGRKHRKKDKSLEDEESGPVPKGPSTMANHKADDRRKLVEKVKIKKKDRRA